MLRWLYFLPATAWAGVIFWLSIAPSLELPKIDLFEEDKIGHFGAYAVLTLLLVGAGQRWVAPEPIARRPVWLWALLAFLFGVFMECYQGLFVPGRLFDPYDMLANGVGAAFMAWAWVKWYGRKAEVNEQK